MSEHKKFKKIPKICKDHFEDNQFLSNILNTDSVIDPNSKIKMTVKGK